MLFFFRLLFRLIFPFALVLTPWFGQAEEKPLWEFGLGAGALHQPCYVGSREDCENVFPVVLPIYRGNFFKSDEQGVRAEFVSDERYEFDVSADFNFAVDSDEVELREGLPDIGNLLQIGPTLKYTPHKSHLSEVFINFPLRVVLEIEDVSTRSAGYTFSPGVVYKRRIDDSSWRITTGLSVLFRTQDFNELYYTVEPRFATFDRPQFKSGGGFSGTRLQLALSSNTAKNLWVFFIRYDNINGTNFADSPLVETQHSVTAGLLYSRYLFKSEKTVIQID